MRVLVAGDRGYIGAVLVPFLRDAGHEVDGLDLGLYEGCDLGPALADMGRHVPRATLGMSFLTIWPDMMRSFAWRHCLTTRSVTSTLRRRTR